MPYQIVNGGRIIHEMMHFDHAGLGGAQQAEQGRQVLRHRIDQVGEVLLRTVPHRDGGITLHGLRRTQYDRAAPGLPVPANAGLSRCSTPPP